MPDVCNIALIGQKFMGRVHCNAYLQAPRFFNLSIKPIAHTVVGKDLISLAPFADRWGFRKYNLNWKDVVKDPEVHLVDISSPSYMHAEQALAAISAGKHVACERPLSSNLKDARSMRNAAGRSSRSRTFVWFNYRRTPAIAFARQLVKEGRLGRIYHLRASFLQSWGGPAAPLTWRFQKKYAGYGAHGDLNSHMIDLSRFVTGQEFTEITGAISETVIVDRVLAEQPKAVTARSAANKARGKSDVDDATMFLARMSGGTFATFEASRIAAGHHNNNMLELNGEHGAVRFSFEDMGYLWFYDNREDRRTAGWRRIQCTSAGNHPYAGAWWPDGHPIGYEHTFVNLLADMMASLAGQEPTMPLSDFHDAYEAQRVLEAVLLSAKHRAAVKLAEIK